MWLDNKSYSYSGGKMVDGNFDITWIPVNYDLTNFIGVSHCPGKYSNSSGSEDQLRNDLKSLKNQKVDAIISLISDFEIERLGIVNFRENLKYFGFIHYDLPINDFSVPKGDFTNSTRGLVMEITNLFKNKKSILVHCNAGLGRSGLIVGLVVKYVGDLKDPVAHVRRFRPGAIETTEQKHFIANFKFSNKG